MNYQQEGQMHLLKQEVNEQEYKAIERHLVVVDSVFQAINKVIESSVIGLSVNFSDLVSLYRGNEVLGLGKDVQEGLVTFIMDKAGRGLLIKGYYKD